MPNELKPCPFCGSADVRIATGANLSWVAVKYRGNIRVVCCAECGVNGGVFNTLSITEEKAEKAAIESWNRRADNG